MLCRYSYGNNIVNGICKQSEECVPATKPLQTIFTLLLQVHGLYWQEEEEVISDLVDACPHPEVDILLS